MERIARLITIALLVALFTTVSFVAGFVAHAYVATADIALPIGGQNPNSADRPANFDIFWEAWDILKREFYGELPEGRQVTYAAIRGVLVALGDPNTILVEPVERELEQDQFRGEFGGIGAYVTMNEQGQLVIVSPIDDTPAARAGLQADDIILEVDGQPLAGKDLNEAVSLIRGPVGTQVTLTVLRPGEEEPFTVTLTRERIPTPTVEYRLIENTDIGYLRLSFFSERTPKEVDQALAALEEEGARRLILDLRNNPGGLLDSAIEVTSDFLAPGTVVAYQQFKDGSRETHTAERGGRVIEWPMVVLVNDGSASASEIVAGALKAHGRGLLIGRQTFGKGTVQIPYELSDGSSLHVTVAHWLTPDEKDLSQEGLVPDIWVELEEKDQLFVDDAQLRRAVEYLQTGE
ncbi:MAG: S41 family peptidase [Ardenticatenia bacterium]|nr:S41 family peptidase [Ardenticatenia bacterium]